MLLDLELLLLLHHSATIKIKNDWCEHSNYSVNNTRMRLQCLNVRALNIHTFYFEFILVTSIHQIEQIVLRTESIVNKSPTKQYIHILNTSSNKPYWYGKARYLDPHVTFFIKQHIKL